MNNRETKEADPEIPDMVLDNTTSTSYIKGRFYGKCCLSKCYEITDSKNGQVYAGKIVSMKLLTKKTQKEKVTQEIDKHQSLKHSHILQFCGFSDDSHFVYIVLEQCRKRHDGVAQAVESFDSFDYMHQILLGTQHLHEKRIILNHLKLGNLFLGDDVNVKIGDFGLAARIRVSWPTEDNLKWTTLNYNVPEILNKKDHSCEVDV